jgi:glycosyltransferase 2 family protein
MQLTEEKWPGEVQKRKFAIPLWGRFVICCLLVGLLVSRMDFGYLAARFSRASMFELMVLICVYMLYHLVCGCRWHGLLRCVEPAITLARVLRISFISVFLGTMMPGTIGAEVSRIVGVSRSNVTVTKAVFSVALDRLLGSVTLALLVLAGLTVATEHMSVRVWPVAALTVAGAVIISAAATNSRVREAIMRAVPGRMGLKLVSRFAQIAQCIDAFRDKPAAVAKALVLSLTAQLIRVLTVWLAGRALGLHIPFGYLMVVVPLVLFLLMLPITIGGLGVREAGYIYFLGIIGISDESAFALSITLYIALILSTVPGGVLLLLGNRGVTAPTPASSALRLGPE